MSLFDTVLTNLQQIDPSVRSAPVVAPTAALSRPVPHTGAKVKLLREYVIPQFYKNGKPKKPDVYPAGRTVELFSNHQGGLKLVESYQVFADDSYAKTPLYREPPIREGVDFAFI